MTVKKVAVIIPANETAGLKMTLDSLKEQDSPRLIIVILNGEAIDDCDDLHHRYPEVVFLTTAKQGISNALNCGLSEALTRGCDYIARADCACLYRQNWLRQSISAIEENPDWSLVWSGRTFSDIDLLNPNFQPFREVTDMSYRLFYGNPINHPTVVMRSTIFTDLDTWYQSVYDGCEDLELWCRLSRLGYRFGRSQTLTLKSMLEDSSLVQSKIISRFSLHKRVVEEHRSLLGVSRGFVKENKRKYSEVFYEKL